MDQRPLAGKRKLSLDTVAWQTLDASIAPVLIVEFPDAIPPEYCTHVTASELGSSAGLERLFARMREDGIFKDEAMMVLWPYLLRVMGPLTDLERSQFDWWPDEL